MYAGVGNLVEDVPSLINAPYEDCKVELKLVKKDMGKGSRVNEVDFIDDGAILSSIVVQKAADASTL
jgi:hypothetical protein